MDKNIFVIVRAYEELNTYLPPGRQKTDFSVALETGADLRGLLSQLHIPENLVDLILVNGHSASLHHMLENRDRIAIYPVFESLDISGISQIDRSPLRRPKFIATENLKELAKGLQSIGFDVITLSGEISDEEVKLMTRSGRILLTKDPGVLTEGAFDRAILIKATVQKRQMAEIAERLQLRGLIAGLLKQDDTT